MNNQNKNYWYHASFVLKFEHYNLDIVSDFDIRIFTTIATLWHTKLQNRK